MRENSFFYSPRPTFPLQQTIMEKKSSPVAKYKFVTRVTGLKKIKYPAHSLLLL